MKDHISSLSVLLSTIEHNSLGVLKFPARKCLSVDPPVLGQSGFEDLAC